MKLTFQINYEPHWGELLRMNNWYLAILGNQPYLDNWDEKKAFLTLMKTTDFRTWTYEVEGVQIEYPIEYKYLIYNPLSEIVVAWENRENRNFYENPSEEEDIVILDNGLYFDVNIFKGAGVAIPVFSLRSSESFGVGEFLDLRKMIDWAKLTGQRLIQTLPVNDTTLQRNKADSYPYNTLSVFALHPMYLRLEAMGTLKDTAKRAYFDEQRKLLNAFPLVDYERVNNLKWEYFQLIFRQEKSTVLSQKEYKFFVETNKTWLYPYAVFSFLRDKYQTSNFTHWPEGSVFSDEMLVKLIKHDSDRINLYFYVQYNLHIQLSEVHAYAQRYNIMLKGDIPIGVSSCSVDVWVNSQLFHLNTQAGAPPDDFSTKGQNWGFPTYNWELMAKDGYAWWKERLKHMSTYFDAYRLDHILGFFRIWEIPTHAKWGLLGQFNSALPLSENDIESYGLIFNENRYLKPHISNKVLREIFGDSSAEVKNEFIIQDETGAYLLNPKFDTQRKVSAYFSAKKELSEKDKQLREGLLKLICQVLFVKDARNPDFYHPRISYQDNESYMALPDSEKDSYIRLYEDFFYHRHNDFWKYQAMKKIPALLHATSMLAFGEDLGMIPSCVPEVMRDLDLISLEIQRMPKQFGQEFGVTYFAPYLSVCTTSTHDMNPLRGWWEEDREKTQRYFNNTLFENGEAPNTCEPWIAEKIIAQHIQSPAMWVILPIQDWLAMDANLRNPDAQAERINVPDNPDNVWCYRMHLDIDRLLAATEFNTKLFDMIQNERH